MLKFFAYLPISYTTSLFLVVGCSSTQPIVISKDDKPRTIQTQYEEDMTKIDNDINDIYAEIDFMMKGL